jgi:hypothetical protein
MDNRRGCPIPGRLPKITVRIQNILTISEMLKGESPRAYTRGIICFGLRPTRFAAPCSHPHPSRWGTPASLELGLMEKTAITFSPRRHSAAVGRNQFLPLKTLNSLNTSSSNRLPCMPASSLHGSYHTAPPHHDDGDDSQNGPAGCARISYLAAGERYRGCGSLL